MTLTVENQVRNTTHIESDSTEIPHGFKMTELGLIPEDWEINSIINLASITTGSKNTQDNVQDGRYPFFVRSSTLQKINTYSFDGEAVLTAGDGVGTGKVFHYINGKFDFHQRVYKISHFCEHLHGYFFYLFFSNYFYNRIMQMTAKSSVDSVRREMIADMLIPLPPIPQQRAIAAAISDIDSLINSLNQLITKKRNIKLAAMQGLLTGKQRLPKFNGEWEVKTLREVCHSINDGTHFTPKYVSEGVPFYSVENVTANNFVKTKYISVQEHEQLIKRCYPQKGDILMTRIGSLGETKLIDWDVNASIYVSLALLKVNEKIDSNYLYNYTKSREFVKSVEARSLLNASPKKINMSEIGSISILVPSTKQEQKAIAEVLTYMDKEISALEQQLAKARNLKQGMMQELLTGRIRLT